MRLTALLIFTGVLACNESSVGISGNELLDGDLALDCSDGAHCLDLGSVDVFLGHGDAADLLVDSTLETDAQLRADASRPDPADWELDGNLSSDVMDAIVNMDVTFEESDVSLLPDFGDELDAAEGSEDASSYDVGLPNHCFNGELDEGESAIDCDGDCPPCTTFVVCENSRECGSDVCFENRCVANHCDDGLLNFDETSVDCGGSCGQCEFQGCAADVDCATGKCVSGRCVLPVCGNGILDPGEECDDGNEFRFDGCLPDCLIADQNLCMVQCSTQGTRLTPSGTFIDRVGRPDAIAGDAFGLSLAQSNDQVFIGAPFAGFSGAVGVYKKTGQSLVFVEELVPRSVTAPERFGATLAADRDTLLIGAPGAANGGAVYVFQRSGGEQWVQTQVLSQGDAPLNSSFGHGALSVYGDVAVVGAPRDDSFGPQSGSVYVYRKGGDNRFSLAQKLSATQPMAYANFGESVDTRNGLILVGAPALQSAPNGYGRFKGAAYLFGFDGQQWTEEQKLVAEGIGGLNGYNFGTSVLLSEGDVFVTAPREDFTAAQSGVVYRYRMGSTGHLVLDQKFGLPEPSPGSLLGMSIYAYQDLVLVGQPFRMSPSGLNNAGGVAVFQSLNSDRYRYAGVWENEVPIRNGFFGAQNLVVDDVVVVSTHGDGSAGVGSGAVTLVKLRSPLCDSRGECICEAGAEGSLCDELTLCGDGIVQPSEQCDTGIFTSACEPGCIRPNCSDGLQNGNETDIDCGGACGPSCASNEVCVTDFDCLSRSCGLNRLCQLPNCHDGIQNGDEPDVDCGQGCETPCSLGQYCYANSDCESEICGPDGVCKPMNRVSAPIGASYQDFGAKVSIDGPRMIVGAPANEQIGPGVGAAYIFEQRENGRWEIETILIPETTNSNMRFGSAVAIQGDIAVVGAPGTTPLSDFNTGAAFVYRRLPEGWRLAQRLVTSDGPNVGEFGSAVVIGHGQIVIGASQGLGGARGVVQNAGSAHVFFEDSGGVFTEISKLYDAQGGSGSRFGEAIVLDGEHLVIGASGDNFNQGAVLVFNLNYGASGELHWALSRRLVLPLEAVSGSFGSSLALSGNRLAVSAPKSKIGEHRSGSVHLFEYHGSGNWLQQGKLTSPIPFDLSGFGFSMAMHGNTLLVSQVPNLSVSEVSSVLEFNKTDSSTWLYTREIVPLTEVVGTRFGHALAVDTQHVAVGAPNSDRGDVYLFDRAD